MPITVYILTTQGPVRVQRITEEQTGIQSVVCLDGRAQALPISSRYDAFVRNPTGVVERATGHGAYRIDVDGIIDDGDSWQLGIFIAHLTAGIETQKNVHIFATGEIDRDLNVWPVQHVGEKLNQALDKLNALSASDAEVHVFAPDADSEISLYPTDVQFSLIGHINDVFDSLDLPRPGSASNGNTSAPLVKDGRQSRWPLWGTVLLASLFLWFLWTPLQWFGLASDGKALELEQSITNESATIIGKYQSIVFSVFQEWRRPKGNAPDLQGEVTVAPTSLACQNEDVVRQTPWMSVIPSGDTICMIEVIGAQNQRGVALVGRMAYWPRGLGQSGKPARTMRGSASPNGHTWKLEFEDFPTRDAVVRLVILQGFAKPTGPQPWFATLLSAPTNSVAFNVAKIRIERLGYQVSVQDWQRP